MAVQTGGTMASSKTVRSHILSHAAFEKQYINKQTYIDHVKRNILAIFFRRGEKATKVVAFLVAFVRFWIWLLASLAELLTALPLVTPAQTALPEPPTYLSACLLTCVPVYPPTYLDL